MPFHFKKNTLIIEQITPLKISISPKSTQNPRTGEDHDTAGRQTRSTVHVTSLSFQGYLIRLLYLCFHVKVPLTVPFHHILSNIYLQGTPLVKQQITIKINQ